MTAVDGRGWRDVALAVLTLQWAGTGLWALLAPRSFYDSFPGGGRTWVSVDGPFNEHLLRDVGALFFALGVLSAYALWQRTPAVVRAAGLAVAVFSLPHLLYHLANTDVLEATDVVLNVGGLVLVLALAVALVVSPGPVRGRSRSQE